MRQCSKCSCKDKLIRLDCLWWPVKWAQKNLKYTSDINQYAGGKGLPLTLYFCESCLNKIAGGDIENLKKHAQAKSKRMFRKMLNRINSSVYGNDVTIKIINCNRL